MNDNMMSVAELIEALQEMPQDAKAMTLEGPITVIETGPERKTVLIY